MRTRRGCFWSGGHLRGDLPDTPSGPPRKVYYANKAELTNAIYQAFPIRTGTVNYHMGKAQK